MGDLESHLQLAMVAYVGGARHDISPAFMVEALGATMGVESEWISVHLYRLEDFLVVFARPEDRNRVASKPSIEFNNVHLFFIQWNHQA